MSNVTDAITIVVRHGQTIYFVEYRKGHLYNSYHITTSIQPGNSCGTTAVLTIRVNAAILAFYVSICLLKAHHMFSCVFMVKPQSDSILTLRIIKFIFRSVIFKSPCTSSSRNSKR